MANIVDSVIGDRAVQLGSEEFVRQMSFGGNWSKIRIGMLLMLNGNSSIATARLGAGVCVGTTNTFSSSSCTGWVGGTNDQSLGSLTYDAVNFRYGFGGGAATLYSVLTKVGNVITTTAGGTNQGWIAAPAGNKPMPFVWEIYKLPTAPVGTYAVSCIAPNTTAQAIACSRTNLMYMLEDEAATSTVFTTYAALTQGNSASYQTLNGSPDTVSIIWNKASPTVEFSNLTVVRIS